MTEVWVPIQDATGYEVSNHGRVRSVDRVVNSTRPYSRKGKIIAPGFVSGYLQVGLRVNGANVKRYVHVLVAREFCPGAKPGFEVNHLDGNKSNCRSDNLEWTSHKDNVRHSIDVLGHKRMGSASGKAKLTEDKVTEIRRLSDRGVATSQIAKKFGVAPCTIHFVKNRVTWRHVL